MKLTLLIILLFSGLCSAKKLEIHKCILANGTVSFQEEKCTVDVYHLKTPKDSNKSKKITKKKKLKHQLAKKAAKKTPQIKRAKKTTTARYFTASDKTSLNASVGQYRIRLSLPKDWKYFNKVYSQKLYHVKMINQNKALQASLMIDFVFPDNKKFSQKEIDNLVQLLGSRFVKKSQENQVNIQNFTVNDGKGALATFTSNEYMPKYRYTTKGAIFKNKWLIQFTLLSNNLQGSSHHNALYALSQTIKITWRYSEIKGAVPF